MLGAFFHPNKNTMVSKYFYLNSKWMRKQSSMCSTSALGLFYDLMNHYWTNDCNFSLEQALSVCGDDTKYFNELIDNKIISIKDDHLVIKFLDEQYVDFATGDLSKYE